MSRRGSGGPRSWEGRRGWIALAWLAPAAGVASGVLGNVITDGWNWWVFAGLVVLSVIVTMGGLATARWTAPQALMPTPLGGSPIGGMLLPVPAGTRVFTGRVDELRSLTDAGPSPNRQGPLVAVITGIAGSGKTELAVRAARLLGDRFPDGVWWVSFRTYAAWESRLGTSEALRSLLIAMGVPADPVAVNVDSLSAIWRSATAGRRVLLVLDDVDDAAQVGPLLPAGDESAVLLTSRHVLTGLDPDRLVRLEPFSEDEARELAGATLRRAGRPDSAAAERIAAAYRLPLAVRQMSDLVVLDPGANAPDGSGRPVTRPAARDETADALAVSVTVLSPRVRQLLRRTARYPGSRITAAEASVAAGHEYQQAAAELAELYRRGLLVAEASPGVYRMHDLIRAAGLRDADEHESRRQVAACETRIFRYAFAAVHEASRVIYQGISVTDPAPSLPRGVPLPWSDSDAAAMAWFDLHHADLLAVTRRCVATRSEVAWRLVYDLEYYLRIRGFYQQIRELHEAAAPVVEASGDRLGEAALVQNLGLLRMLTGDYSGAREHFHRALAGYTSVDHLLGQHEVHHELAQIALWREDLPSAEYHVHEVLRLSERIQEPLGHAFAHRTAGILHRLREDHAASRRELETALRLYEATGHRRGVGTAHLQLGLTQAASGELDDAGTHLSTALEIFEDYGDAFHQVEAHHGLAVLHRRARHTQLAKEHAATALALGEDVSHLRGQAEAHVELGLLAQDAGDINTAHRHWRTARKLYQRLDAPARSTPVDSLLNS